MWRNLCKQMIIFSLLHFVKAKGVANMEGYHYSAGFSVTKEVKKRFDEDGYILIRNILSSEEHELLKKAIDDPEGVLKYQYKVQAEDDRSVTMSLWNNPGNDITGLIARSEKVATTCEKLLSCEVFHFHGKILKKVPVDGGNFVWHQDYGYWYKNGFLYPDLITVFIPVDETTIENGCLQVLRGSHKCGRIDHARVEGEQGADVERVEAIERRCPLQFIEMKCGDALFFHSNLIHCSGHNKSSHRRIVYSIAFCSTDNDAVYQHPFAYSNPLQKIKDDDIVKCHNIVELTGKEFLDPKNDYNIKVKT